MSQNELEILQEIGKIGSRSASAALAVLLEKKVDSASPSVDIVSATKLNTILKAQEFSGVYLPIRGACGVFLMQLLPGTVLHTPHR